MGESRGPGVLSGRILGLAVCAMAAVSCTSGSGGSAPEVVGQMQPAGATYRCDGGEALRIENRRSSVTVAKSDGTRIDLPASPPDSRARYGEPPYALVLDGREALYIETGKTPMNCRR